MKWKRTPLANQSFFAHVQITNSCSLFSLTKQQLLSYSYGNSNPRYCTHLSLFHFQVERSLKVSIRAGIRLRSRGVPKPVFGFACKEIFDGLLSGLAHSVSCPKPSVSAYPDLRCYTGNPRRTLLFANLKKTPRMTSLLINVPHTSCIAQRKESGAQLFGCVSPLKMAEGEMPDAILWSFEKYTLIEAEKIVTVKCKRCRAKLSGEWENWGHRSWARMWNVCQRLGADIECWRTAGGLLILGISHHWFEPKICYLLVFVLQIPKKWWHFFIGSGYFGMRFNGWSAAWL